MRYFFDTEFIEDGKTIDLLSIGIVAEDGRELYQENSEADFAKASPWVRENVFPSLIRSDEVFQPRELIAARILEFVGFDRSPGSFAKPQFWAYYASYDWVVLCQLFGTIMDLPKGWPMYVNDIKQMCRMVGDPKLPEPTGRVHNALDDARWNRDVYEFLRSGRLP